MKTAMMNETLIPPPQSSVRPIAADSGIPSSSAPRTIARGSPSAVLAARALVVAAALPSRIRSPKKKVSAPPASPIAAEPPPPISIASSVRSKTRR